MRVRLLVMVVGTCALWSAPAMAFEVGVEERQTGKSAEYYAKFNAAPWEANRLTVNISNDGHTVRFSDPASIIGMNPTMGDLPCERLSDHAARCDSPRASQPFALVITQLGDGGSTYRDKMTGSPGDLYQWIDGGVGDDNIVVSTSRTAIDDFGGTNYLQITGSAWGSIGAWNGVNNRITVFNGRPSDGVQCGVAATSYSDGGGPVLVGSTTDTVYGDSGDYIDCDEVRPG
jgi:hypothetical protein